MTTTNPSDSDFKAKLKTIRRLTGAISGMQTYVEDGLVHSGLTRDAAKAEVKRLKERDNLSEVQMGLYLYTQTSVSIWEPLSKEERRTLFSKEYLKYSLMHEEMKKELSDLLKSLTPDQMKIVNARNRRRLLYEEKRRKQGKSVIRRGLLFTTQE